MIKRMSINLDQNLLAEARAALGTTGTADTVHRSLEEVVRRNRLSRVADERFEDLTLKALDQLRAPRSW